MKNRTAYEIKIEQFQGPLDVLLQFIESRELEITDISLAEIAETFIRHLDQVETKHPEELADFLVVATRLLYLKSRALLPLLEQPDEDMDESQLAERLKMYKEFRDASEVLTNWISRRQFSLGRPVTAKQLEIVEFSPPATVTLEVLAETYQNVIEDVETVIKIPKAAIRKAVTLKDKISALNDVLREHEELSFSELIGAQTSKIDIVVTFLAVLELIKQNSVLVKQSQQYSDITIKRS